MPELPEVEVVKRSLEKEIKNLTIQKIKIFDGDLRYKVKNQELNKIVGLKLLKIQRRSKYLLFFFSKKNLMVAHLGMTGKFLIEKKNRLKQKTSFYYQADYTKNKHDRIEFLFHDNIKIIYNDIRKFGFIKLERINKNICDIKFLKILGPEPLSNELNFKYFKKYLVGKKRNIKSLLMDQKFISGLGNIYVNEILFKSKVRPSKKVSRLRDSEIKYIIFYTKRILKNAIIKGGSSIKDFSNSTGKQGKFQQHFNVYGKQNEECSNTDCNKIIKKIVIGGRASFFCSKCQK